MEILLGGKQRRLKFGIFALQVFVQRTDFQTPQADLYASIYAGLKYATYVSRDSNNETNDFSFEEVCEWCDEANQDELVRAYNVFTETRVFQQWFNKMKEAIAKMANEVNTKEETETV